eukprot:CAMPEP_0196147468 /NCGR_PEP_ID=MMETSP0910-20130528/25475_1 /TAXON_ID=49265 /ORGANISM="Thalassiosira rotula, Strain GSO102" /LENGTH=43 /DNA_ID= /DNA_START= /DNA_END= /DNA_ORIENTATION=
MAAMASSTTRTSPNIRITSCRKSSTPHPSFTLNSIKYRSTEFP